MWSAGLIRTLLPCFLSSSVLSFLPNAVVHTNESDKFWSLIKPSPGWTVGPTLPLARRLPCCSMREVPRPALLLRERGTLLPGGMLLLSYPQFTWALLCLFQSRCRRVRENAYSKPSYCVWWSRLQVLILPFFPFYFCHMLHAWKTSFRNHIFTS